MKNLTTSNPLENRIKAPSPTAPAEYINKAPRRVFNPPSGAEGRPTIRRLLIANRGEIACRVIATCRELSITSIAVYTDPDSHSLHVKEADQAVRLGPIDGPDGNPHQNIDLIIQIALAHKADAIHPGYGYMSENAEFAQRVRDANLIFLGPSPNSMAVLGDKRSAKLFLSKHAPEVPLIPGYNGSAQNISSLLVEADHIGFPILIKASAGGGGKGMRIVHEPSRLGDELSRAQSEANRSFGSSDCILEKYIRRSKHIEIQILGDSHGNVISLLDRECSVQRRHQKVIEEAPSPWLSPELRQEMSETAVLIGKLLQYESAGTVEFIVDIDTSKFYFLEVNTRIQVEHPITEETLGVDIVSLQIYTAAGGNLDDIGLLRAGSIVQSGHAIECRLCAEDPARDFMPDLGPIRRWTPATQVLPISQTQNVRYETSMASGSHISIHFDSMIAKIVVWAPSRSLAIAKMLRILSHTVCVGIRTNQAFLQACLLHPGFQDPEYSTSFIPDYIATLNQNPYVENLPEAQRLLSFLPSMLSRQIGAGQLNTQRPFKGLPRGFRNQKTDRANAQVDVVRIPSLSSEAMLVEWPVGGNPLADSHTVHINPLPKASDISTPTPMDRKRLKPSEKVAQEYNRISEILRRTNQSKRAALHISLKIHSSSSVVGVSGDRWLLRDLLVDVDGHRWQVLTVNEADQIGNDVGAHQKFYCHVPALGTSVEYHRFSLLTLGESLRALAGASEADLDHNPKAPMPCKIFTILKKEGESVKKGEITMVIESMKMEMNVLATMEGVFNTKVAKGDAVEEGTVLFTIS